MPRHARATAPPAHPRAPRPRRDAGRTYLAPGILKSERLADGQTREDSEIPRVGDHVWVEAGEYQGCILDLLRVEETGTGPVFVCKRSSPPYEIRTRLISLYRRWPQ